MHLYNIFRNNQGAGVLLKIGDKSSEARKAGKDKHQTKGDILVGMISTHNRKAAVRYIQNLGALAILKDGRITKVRD